MSGKRKTRPELLSCGSGGCQNREHKEPWCEPQCFPSTDFRCAKSTAQDHPRCRRSQTKSSGVWQCHRRAHRDCSDTTQQSKDRALIRTQMRRSICPIWGARYGKNGPQETFVAHFDAAARPAELAVRASRSILRNRVTGSRDSVAVRKFHAGR